MMSPLVVNLSKVAVVVVIYLFLAVVARAVRAQVTAPAARPATAKGPATPAPVLVITAPDGSAGRQIEVRRTIVVGRGEAADVTLSDDFTSERHARFENRGGALFVEDLGSTNGTFVNGERIDERTDLAAGDTVRVGGTIMEMR
jgi:pSer/pThr/pTyr-binding forkhead associated (FHA) protein